MLNSFRGHYCSNVAEHSTYLILGSVQLKSFISSSAKMKNLLTMHESLLPAIPMRMKTNSHQTKPNGPPLALL